MDVVVIEVERQSAIKAKATQPKIGGVSRSRFAGLFADEQSCWNHLKAVRLDSVPCPSCGIISTWKRSTKSRCRHSCGFTKSPTHDTMFYRSHLPLQQAFYGLLLFANMNIGVRSAFIARHLGLFHSRAIGFVARARRQAALLETATVIGGPGKLVYIDEMLLNVRRSNDGRFYGGRFGVIVFGLRCDDRIQLFLLPERSNAWTRQVIQSYVAPGSKIITDAFPGYSWLRTTNWEHSVINHRKEWVNREGFHHGPIDTVFCQLRRFLRGCALTPCSTSLWEYLAEFQFRFNRRWHPERRFLDLVEHCPTMTSDTLRAAERNFDLREFFMV